MDISELKPGLHVVGVLPSEVVEIVAATPAGNAVNVFYLRLDGTPGTVVLFPEDCLKLHVSEGGDRRPFNADPNGFLLAAEALRIRYSYVFDTRLAMHTSMIEPLPHQITAVYEQMLRKDPLRFLLADDPGAGKTIMAGLLIKELMIRGDVERCLIVCPGGLAQQWVEDEMGPKFGLEFRMLTNDVVDSTKSGNPFLDIPLMVASVDKLARDERVQQMLKEASWDLVIVDEAHKMAAHVNGRKIDYTRRYRLGRLLSERTRHMLLMTATPHNGREADFQEFMKLLDRDLFESGSRSDVKVDLSSIMRRLQKEELLTFEGKPLFPIREAKTVQVSLTDREQSLYDHVTAYVREGFNRAERIVSGDKKNAVGFAMTSLQRRLASSPLAAYRSLNRRRLRLEERANEVRERGTYTIGNVKVDPDEWAWDDWDADDREAEQDTQEGIVVRGIVVEGNTALRQKAFDNDEEKPGGERPGGGAVKPGVDDVEDPPVMPAPDDPLVVVPQKREVQLEAVLDRLTAGMQVGGIVEEMLQPLYDLGATEVDLVFSASVTVPDGIDDGSKRALDENASVLKSMYGVTVTVR